MLKILISALIAWILAEGIKITPKILIKHEKLGFYQLFKPGGMPSAHSSTVTALTLAVYFDQGLTPLSIVTMVISLLVIRDTTLRIKEYRHKPKEVAVGIILGLIITYLVYSI